MKPQKNFCSLFCCFFFFFREELFIIKTVPRSEVRRASINGVQVERSKTLKRLRLVPMENYL